MVRCTLCLRIEFIGVVVLLIHALTATDPCRRQEVAGFRASYLCKLLLFCNPLNQAASHPAIIALDARQSQADLGYFAYTATTWWRNEAWRQFDWWFKCRFSYLPVKLLWSNRFRFSDTHYAISWAILMVLSTGWGSTPLFHTLQFSWV